MLSKVGPGELAKLAALARDEADSDLILIEGTNAPADRCWCYWYVN
jgi:hypothetical protein